jgi:hypothetical protein
MIGKALSRHLEMLHRHQSLLLFLASLAVRDWDQRLDRFARQHGKDFESQVASDHRDHS